MLEVDRILDVGRNAPDRARGGVGPHDLALPIVHRDGHIQGFEDGVELRRLLRHPGVGPAPAAPERSSCR